MNAAAKPAVGTLLVIGLGLIGGSFALACKQRGLCQRVWGLTQDTATQARALELGIVDAASTQLETLAPQLTAGDMVFIAVPTLSVRGVLQALVPYLSPEVTLTDGCSVKGSVLQDVQAVYGHIPPQVVLGHPIAGAEKSGVNAANGQLYENHRVILTPTEHTGSQHLALVTALWQGVGAKVLQLGVQQHDDILGATSHLPHAIAYALVDTLAQDTRTDNIFRYAAGGFRDFTRIASSDATMWRDIMLANPASVLQALDAFSHNLQQLRTAIAEQNGQQLLDIFSRAKAARDAFVNAPPSP